MFCMKCGQQLSDGVRFCPACGQQNLMAQAVSSPEEVSVAPEAALEPATEVLFNAAPEIAAEVAPEDAPPVEPVYAVTEEITAVQNIPYGYERDTEPAPVKKGGKKFFLLITAAVLALALIVGVAFFALAYNSPEARLGRAIDKTGEQLSEITANAPVVHEMIENVSSMEDGRTIALDYAMEYNMTEMYSSINGIALRFDIDRLNKKLFVSYEMDSSLSIAGMPEYDYDQSLRYELYADEDYVMASVPGSVDDYYSLPVDHLGEKLAASELGGLLEKELDQDVLDFLFELDPDFFNYRRLDAAKELCPQEYKAFMDSLVVEKSDKRLPCDGEYDVVLYATCDMEALIELIAVYSLESQKKSFGTDRLAGLIDTEESVDEMTELFAELEIDLYFGIKDGVLTAIHCEYDDDGETGSLTFSLEGRDNIWEAFVLYVDEEETMTGGVTSTRNGFVLSMIAEGEELLLTFDDKDGLLTVEFDGEELAVLGYSANDGGMCITYSSKEEEDGYDSSIDLALKVLPLEEIKTPREHIDLLSLDEDELYDLYRDLEGLLE